MRPYERENQLYLNGKRCEIAKPEEILFDYLGKYTMPGMRVLDIGCGDGELLVRLTADKQIKGHCIELDQDLLRTCVEKGLPTIQRDIERGLEAFADKTFDYIILSQTLQTIKNPEKVFVELLRVGKKVIVSFPNFAHWKCRFQLLLNGKAPITRQLPFGWYDSPNVHCLSLKDFEEFCRRLDVRIENRIPLKETRLSPVLPAPFL